MNKGNKISKEVAEKEVEKWLDYKKVDENKRTDNEDSVKTLTQAIELGYLTFNSKDNTFTHKLKFPIGETDPLVELVYKPRLKMSEVHLRTQNIKSNDTFGLITAYVCALTGVNSGVIKDIETEDNRICQAIAIFFL